MFLNKNSKNHAILSNFNILFIVNFFLSRKSFAGFGLNDVDVVAVSHLEFKFRELDILSS